MPSLGIFKTDSKPDDERDKAVEELLDRPLTPEEQQAQKEAEKI
ncbi:MAG: hypothetical protein WAP52_02675 [Candidatus Sungiibacteriota bacterium]